MRHRLLAAGLTAILAVGPVVAVPAQAAPLPAAVSCSGVWVVVDFGSLGNVRTECATQYSTGTAALRKAGFAPNIEDGFVLKIGGKPSGKSDPNKAYWSYWHATRRADGSYSDWSYSGLGADAYHPKKGDAEGWHYVSLSEKASGPGTVPAANPAVTATPTPTTASPKPTKKATASGTASASASTKATATATAKTTTRASASPSATESSLTPSAVASTTTTDVTAVAAEAPTAEAPPPASGNPTGTIAAGVAVIAAAGGLGGWWLVKGRRR